MCATAVRRAPPPHGCHRCTPRQHVARPRRTPEIDIIPHRPHACAACHVPRRGITVEARRRRPHATRHALQTLHCRCGGSICGTLHTHPNTGVESTRTTSSTSVAHAAPQSCWCLLGSPPSLQHRIILSNMTTRRLTAIHHTLCAVCSACTRWPTCAVRAGTHHHHHSQEQPCTHHHQQQQQ